MLFGPVVIVVLAIIFLVLFFSFVPLGLWISARASGVKVGVFQLVGMRVRKVIPARIVNPLIKATKAGTVRRILVTTGAPVEYGQPLMIVE